MAIHKSVWHVLLFGLHLGQSIAQFVLAANSPNVWIPLFTTTPTLTPWNPNVTFETNVAFSIHPMFLVASFLCITALSHLMSAILSICYDGELSHVIRNIEYSITATIMVIAILLMSGVNDLFAIISSATCNVCMILCGLIIDSGKYNVRRLVNSQSTKLENNRTKQRTFIIGTPYLWYMFFIGCVAAGAPWVCIFTSIGLNVYVPNIVYWVTVSIFVCFFGFAFHSAFELYLYQQDMNRQLANNGWLKWYLDREEEIYMVLSLVSKTNLSWSVYVAFLQ